MLLLSIGLSLLFLLVTIALRAPRLFLSLYLVFGHALSHEYAELLGYTELVVGGIALRAMDPFYLAVTIALIIYLLRQERILFAFAKTSCGALYLLFGGFVLAVAGRQTWQSTVFTPPVN